jgi:hypothetical protein
MNENKTFKNFVTLKENLNQYQVVKRYRKNKNQVVRLNNV